MADPKTNSKQPAWKIALIPVLGIVLVWHTTSGGAEVATPETPDTGEIASDGDSLVETDLPLAELLAEIDATESNDQAVPVMDLVDVMDHDPFALTGQLAQRVLGPPQAIVSADGTHQPQTPAGQLTPQKRLENLLSRTPLEMIATDARGGAALIDHRIVRVGDMLDDGLQVVEISRAGIRVKVVD